MFFKDDYSKEIGGMIAAIGVKLLRSLKFRHVRKLIDFLRKLEYQNDELFETHAQLDRRSIITGLNKIKIVLLRLRQQIDIINETYSGSETVP